MTDIPRPSALAGMAEGKMVLGVGIHGMCAAKALRSAMTAGLLAALSAPLGSENITLTTYYPAPVGIYQKMTTTRETLLARDGGFVAVGTLVAPTATTKMVVMGGNVGIGTTAPVSPLSVFGGVQVLDDPSAACTTAKTGTLVWRASSLQVCDGSAWSPLLRASLPAGTLAGTCTCGMQNGTCGCGLPATNGIMGYIAPAPGTRVLVYTCTTGWGVASDGMTCIKF